MIVSTGNIWAILSIAIFIGVYICIGVGDRLVLGYDGIILFVLIVLVALASFLASGFLTALIYVVFHNLL